MQKKKLCSYVILSKIKIKKHENHLKHHSFHLYRTRLARHVPTRTSNHSIPFTRLMAIPKSQLRLARLATQPQNIWSLHPKFPHPPRYSSPCKNNFRIYTVGYNPTFSIHRKPNLAKNTPNHYRNWRNNSHTFIQNSPKITPLTLKSRDTACRVRHKINNKTLYSSKYHH